MEEMESIEYKSGVICISLGDDNKAIDSSNKDYKIDLMWIIVMKTQDLDPGVDFVKGEFWNERERKSFLVNNNPHLHVAHG